MKIALFVMMLAQVQAPPGAPVAAGQADAAPRAGEQSAAAPQPSTDKGPSDYLVGRGDQLNVVIVGADVFNAKVNVDNDGKFQYLDIGRINAAGLSLAQIAREIQNTLGPAGRNMFLNPTVNVDVAEYRSQNIFVTGAVRNPMGYQIKGNTTLMMALASAGFTTSSGQTITVTRKRPAADNSEKPQVFSFARSDLESGKFQDFRLQDNDLIQVAEAEKCFVTGEVRNIGSYEVTSRTLTVNQVIAMAGGLTERGARNRVRIQRKVDGKDTEIKVNKDLTDVVLPGDTIIVPRRIL